MLPGYPGQTQVEIFWPGGNHLYAMSCAPSLPLIYHPSWGYVHDASAGLQDDTWYRYTITVSNAGVVSFSIQNVNLQVIGSASVDDGWNYVPDDIGQWIGSSDGNDDGSWTVDFQDIEAGWYTAN